MQVSWKTSKRMAARALCKQEFRRTDTPPCPPTDHHEGRSQRCLEVGFLHPRRCSSRSASRTQEPVAQHITRDSGQGKCQGKGFHWTPRTFPPMSTDILSRKERATADWPVTVSQSELFNAKESSGLFDFVIYSSFQEAEMDMCCRKIFLNIQIEQQHLNENLPLESL